MLARSTSMKKDKYNSNKESNTTATKSCYELKTLELVKKVNFVLG